MKSIFRALNGFDNPRTAVYDVFAADSRAVMMDAAVRHYTRQYGIKSWWLDCDEPCGAYSAQEHTWYNHGRWPAEAVGAAYPGYLDLAVHEAMWAEGVGGSSVTLGRAFWAGSQRWGGGLWSGDIHSHWAVFSQQFTAGLNAAMSGVVYWATGVAE
jgi:alpha-glucosidase